MILTGHEIQKQVSSGTITIDPFVPEQINPNSYNFRLGNKIKVYDELILDPRKVNAFHEIEIPERGLVLQPDTLYLAHIMEIIGSNHVVPIIKGRSSLARLGLFIVITADLVDQGAFGQWTLQLHAIQPVIIYPGMQIGQVTFWKTQGEPLLYSGKYQGAIGPTESLAYKDFQKTEQGKNAPN